MMVYGDFELAMFIYLLEITLAVCEIMEKEDAIC